MAEDYCSSWSAWKIWRHPKKALDTLIDSGFMQENLESKLQEALCALENSRLEITNLSEQNAIMARKTEEDAIRMARLEEDMENFAAELAETRRSLDAATAELAETRHTLDAANAELTETRRSLEAANTELAERKDVETQLKEFDEKLSRVEQLKADYETKIATLRKQLDDALKTGSTESGLQTRNGESPKIRMKEPDDDWLLDTPDNLI